jgi:Annexin
LATHDATTRTYIAVRYKELYSKELVELMKKEFSGDFGNTIQCLSLRPDRAEALMIKLATKGIGASTNIIWSIVCGRTNAEIDILKKTYFTMNQKDISKLLASELHGDMERLIFTCLQGSEQVYNPQYHTLDKAVEDAMIIHQKGQGRWGTDERGIFKIIGESPKEHLQNVSKYVFIHFLLVFLFFGIIFR